ncbi:hypothetical protein HDU79_011324 [Rhizoclosmatium sp. JEL0117]|nr:hypothetical protein HDU79_011324 [Rhizoclosmatium sp. JEL0117]
MKEKEAPFVWEYKSTTAEASVKTSEFDAINSSSSSGFHQYTSAGSEKAMEWKDLSISDQQVVKQGVCDYLRPTEWQDGKDPSVFMGEGKPYVLIEGKSRLTCFYTYRPHANNRQYVKLDEYGIAYCCRNEGCCKQPTKRKSYRELQNGATLQKIVLRMLYGEQSTVNKSVAKARQNLQDSIYTGSTTGLECNLVNNKLVAPVKEKSELHMMWDVLHRLKRPDCHGQPVTVTSRAGLEVYCDVCNTRTPDLVFPLVSSTAPASTAVLTQYFTQINGNVTITTNTYYGDNNEDTLFLDVQFNVVEPVFEFSELNEVMYKSFSGLPTDIGHVMFYLAKDKFAVSKSTDTKDVWWVWSNHLWVKETNAVEMFCND